MNENTKLTEREINAKRDYEHFINGPMTAREIIGETIGALALAALCAAFIAL